MPVRPGSVPSFGGRKPASTARIRWSSTRTSGCSLRWTARSSGRGSPEALRRAFSLVPEYLRTSDEADSLSDYGPALGRRFRSLKLWAVLRCYGRAGLQARIREAVRLAELFEGWVRDEPGWEVCAPRPLLGRLLPPRRAPTSENEAIVDRVNRSGELFLSHTRLDGRYVLRLAIGNERTTEDDVGGPGSALKDD